MDGDSERPLKAGIARKTIWRMPKALIKESDCLYTEFEKIGSVVM